jgi:hypothetical protein
MAAARSPVTGPMVRASASRSGYAGRPAAVSSAATGWERESNGTPSAGQQFTSWHT